MTLGSSQSAFASSKSMPCFSLLSSLFRGSEINLIVDTFCILTIYLINSNCYIVLRSAGGRGGRASSLRRSPPVSLSVWRTGEMSKSGRGVSRSTARVLLCVVATFSSMAGKPCAPFADICAKSTRNLAGLFRGWLRPCSIIGCLRHFRMRARSGVSHAVLVANYRFSW